MTLRILGRAALSAAAVLLLVVPLRAEQSSLERLLSEGHYKRAQAEIAAMLAKSPQNPEALVGLSTVQWAMGELDAAMATAEKAVAASDQSAATHAQLVNVLGAKLASSKTGTMERFGLSKRFHREIDRTLQLDPKSLYAMEAAARYDWYAPAIGGGDKNKARQMADRVGQLDPVRGWALRAEFDATDSDAAKRQANVVGDWKQAVAAKPDSYAAHIGLGEALLKYHNDAGGAQTEAKAALALDATRVGGYRLLALSDANAGHWDEVEEDLRRARTAIPDDLAPQYEVAKLIIEHGVDAQAARAERYLREYLGQTNEGLEPDMATAHWQLGRLLERQGRKQDALAQVQTAVKLDPSLDGAKRELRHLQ